MGATELGRADGDEPLLPPWPSPDFKQLDRRQSIIAWTIGYAVGGVVAAAVILAVVLSMI